MVAYENSLRNRKEFEYPAPYLIMYHVYVIQSLKTRELYFGRTGDIQSRLLAHNSGKNASTRVSRPWEYVYIESHKSKEDAVKRELQLKQYGNARTYVKQRLSSSLS